LSYQWSFNGTNLLGATNTMLTLTNVQLTQAGNYAVSVTNLYGSTNSANALLTVSLPPTNCDPAPSGLVSWWPGEGNANDVVGTNNGTLEGNVAFVTGEVGQAFSFNNLEAAVQIPASAGLDVGEGAGFTVEAWVNPTNVVIYGPVFEWNTGTNSLWGVHLYTGAIAPVGGPGSLYAGIMDTNGGSHYFASPQGTVATNVFQHVALTYNKGTGVATLYCNGVVVAQQTVGSFTPQTSYNLYLGHRPLSLGEEYTFPGAIDEASVYNRALTSNEIAAIYNAGSGG
jgi:hypothetical protein